MFVEIEYKVVIISLEELQSEKSEKMKLKDELEIMRELVEKLREENK